MPFLYYRIGGKKETGRHRKSSSHNSVHVKSSRKPFPFPTLPWQRSSGSARSTAAAGIQRRVLTGLSQFCSLSSRALWQALCRPHLAVVQSSGPRLEGTFRQSPPPASPTPTGRGAGPANPPRPPLRPGPLGASGPALPGAANLDTFEPARLVRAGGAELGGREGEGRSEVTTSFSNPGGGGREKGNLLN